MKKWFVLIMIVTLLVGCSGGENHNALENDHVDEVVEQTEEEAVVERKTVFIDASGNQLTVESRPEKVVALYGSFADLWYEAGGELIGIIESSTLPQKAMDLPRVGSMSTPNVEAILALEPDMVIIRSGYSKQEDLVSIFESNGILVYKADYNTFEETMATFENFCGMNENEALYTEKSTPLFEGVEALRNSTHDFSYLLLFATSKSISAKDDNITAEIINDLGGENIASNYAIADEESKQFSFEKILELDPTYIFVQTMGTVEDAKARLEEDILSNPAWQSLTAVKEERFIYLPKELFLYKPNMKYLEAYEYMKAILEGQQ